MKRNLKKVLVIVTLVVTVISLTVVANAQNVSKSLEFAGYHFDLSAFAYQTNFGGSLSCYPNPGPAQIYFTTQIDIFAYDTAGNIVNYQMGQGSSTCSTGTTISVPYKYVTAYYTFNSQAFDSLTAYV